MGRDERQKREDKNKDDKPSHVILPSRTIRRAGTRAAASNGPVTGPEALARPPRLPKFYLATGPTALCVANLTQSGEVLDFDQVFVPACRALHPDEVI